MSKFEFVVRSEISRELEKQWKHINNEIELDEFTHYRIVELSLDFLLEYNDFINMEYESGIWWCVDLAIENVLEDMEYENQD